MESACMILKRNTRNSCYGKHKFSNAKNTIDTKLFWWFEAKCRQPKWDGKRRRVYCENKTESPTKLVGWERMRCTVKTFTAYGNFMWIVFFRKRITSCRTWTSLCVSISFTHRVSNESDVLATESALSSLVWIDAFNAAARNPTYTSKSLASWWTNEYIYTYQCSLIFLNTFLYLFFYSWSTLNVPKSLSMYVLFWFTFVFGRDNQESALYVSWFSLYSFFLVLFLENIHLLSYFSSQSLYCSFHSLAGIGCRLNFKC